MMRNQAFRVSGEEAGRRLDRVLRDRYPGIPARSIRFAIEAGAVRVGDVHAPKGYQVLEGDAVSVSALAEGADWLPASCDLPGASVVYEDAEVCVLCKPADAHTEPQRPNEPGTLAGVLRLRHPGVVEISAAPGLTLLTRLDYATSGAVPAALTSAAWNFLRHEREMGRIVKRYLCLVEGEIAAPMSIPWEIHAEGGETVRVMRGRKDPDPLRWTRVDPVRTVHGGTLVEATISRGKRHQIRAHLAAAGHPIVGDRRYSAVPPSGPGKSRLMLHAVDVTLRHPATGETLRVSCPAPEEFGVT